MADNEEEILSPYTNNDAVLKDTVSSLLQSWGLSDLKSKFKSHHVETRALLCLTEQDICELIPKIGRRAIFRSNLLEWRKQNRRRCSTTTLPSKRTNSKSEKLPPSIQPLIKDEDMQSDEESVLHSQNLPANLCFDGIDYDPVQQTRTESQESMEGRLSIFAPPRKNRNYQINVNEILSNSYEGQQIIAYYEVNGNLDYSHRRRLVTLLINEVIRKNRWLVQDDFAKMSNDIIQLFPREDKTTYYIARNGTKNPKGCLYNKFLNLTRKLRQEGILQYRNDVQLKPERMSTRHPGEIKCYRESF